MEDRVFFALVALAILLWIMTGLSAAATMIASGG